MGQGGLFSLGWRAAGPTMADHFQILTCSIKPCWVYPQCHFLQMTYQIHYTHRLPKNSTAHEPHTKEPLSFLIIKKYTYYCILYQILVHHNGSRYGYLACWSLAHGPTPYFSIDGHYKVTMIKKKHLIASIMLKDGSFRFKNNQSPSMFTFKDNIKQYYHSYSYQAPKSINV